MSEGQPEFAIAELVREHAAFLYRFAYRLSGSAHDAEDLTQQAFLAAHRHLGQLREADKTRAWLVAILRNAYRRSFRRQGAVEFCPLDDVPEPMEAARPDSVIEDEQLQSALGDLPEEFRSVIILYYLEHLSYRQIADMLDVPIGTVMSRLSRGKAALRRKLQPEYVAATATDPARNAIDD